MMIVAICLTVPLIAFGFQVARAQQQFDWLIGTWTGDVSGGPGRTESKSNNDGEDD
jgi:hypothetical protein